MAQNPVNLALRFLLELVLLFALGYWGWTQNEGFLRFGFAVGLPILAAGLWGTLRVPNDPGTAPVPVPGPIRLTLEILLFIAGILAFWMAGRPVWALIFAGVLVLHYVASYDRVAWLLRG